LRRYIIEFFAVQDGVRDAFSFALLNLKISDIDDLYDSMTETYTYQMDYAELEASFGSTFTNGEVYNVVVTPRESGAVDLTPQEQSFFFNCPLTGCNDLPCEVNPGECAALIV